MFTILVKPDLTKNEANSPQKIYWIEKCLVDPAQNKLEASMVNLAGLNLLKDRLSTYNRVKSLKTVKKFNFEATPVDSKLLVTFIGNIRDSLFFLNEFGALSKEDYKEGISKLDNISYAFSEAKTATTSQKISNSEEEKQQPSDTQIDKNFFSLIKSNAMFSLGKKIPETNKPLIENSDINSYVGYETSTSTLSTKKN